MPFPTKPILAGVLLTSAAAVWISRAKGFDPASLLGSSSQEHTRSSVPGSISDPNVTVDEVLADGPPAELSLDVLERMVDLLDDRGPSAPFTTGHAVSTVEPQVEAISEGHPGEGAAPESEDQDAQDVLWDYLARNPLNAVVVGPSAGSAIFGRRRVLVGEPLVGEEVVVQAIEREGVVLRTPSSTVRLRLPRYGRQVEAPSRDPQDVPEED